jgi:hypothetical protein
MLISAPKPDENETGRLQDVDSLHIEAPSLGEDNHRGDSRNTLEAVFGLFDQLCLVKQEKRLGKTWCLTSLRPEIIRQV